MREIRSSRKSNNLPGKTRRRGRRRSNSENLRRVRESAIGRDGG